MRNLYRIFRAKRYNFLGYEVKSSIDDMNMYEILR